MSEYISIAAFNDQGSAQKLTERLRSAGFDSELYDESLAQKWRLFQIEPHAQYRVRVLESERALKELESWEAGGSAEELALAVHCPECGSTLVEYPQFSRRTLMGALPAIAASAGIIERDYYCQACHFTWPAEAPSPDQDLDRLNWPTNK